jgi:hypothetical protein
VIRKFCRNLLLRCLIVAFTGDHAADAFKEDEPLEKTRPSAAVTAMQALDQLGSGMAFALLPVTAYEVIRGDGF